MPEVSRLGPCKAPTDFAFLHLVLASNASKLVKYMLEKLVLCKRQLTAHIFKITWAAANVCNQSYRIKGQRKSTKWQIELDLFLICSG